MADVGKLVIDTATREGVPPSVALEVAYEESRLNPHVPDSPAGAIGVMQLTPATAASLGVDPRNLEQNVLGGVRYLGQQLARFGGNLQAAVAAYNWGPERVARAMSSWGSSWTLHLPAETKGYLSRILARLGSQYRVSVQPGQILVDVVRRLPEDGQQAVKRVLWLALLGWGLYLILEEV